MTQPDQPFTATTHDRTRDRRSRRTTSTRRQLAWSVGACFALLGIALISGWIALQRAYDGRIVPNITIQGIAVGSLRPDEARIALRQQYAALLKTPLLVQAAEQRWTPHTEVIGLHVPIDETVAQAFALGRGPNALLDIVLTREVWASGRAIPLVATIDTDRLQAYFETIADELAILPQEATLTVIDGQLRTSPAASGRAADTTTLTNSVAAGLALLQPQAVTIPTRVLRPALDDQGIAAAQQQLTTLLAQPATITVGDVRRTWSPAELGAMVQITRQPGLDGDQLRVAFQPSAITQWLAEIAPQLATEPSEPRLRFIDGRVQIVEPGRDGTRLDVVAAAQAITADLWQGKEQIAVALSPVLPAIRPATLADLGIRALVAEGRSDFSGSAPYRVQNIRAGAAQMDGVLIAPDAEFSFNDQVGAINESNGFTEGYAIINGRTQLEWGGGVCQVSTTVFRAAFWAGVPISERNQHSFRIRWYEVYEPIGMDAAIFTGPGGYDFRFVNDTGSWLLMQTEVDVRRTRLSVRLYGTKPDREIIQTPAEITNKQTAPTEARYVRDDDLPPGAMQQTDTKRGGMDVRIGRVVRQNGTVIYRDTFFSRYQPWPDIFALGPGAEPPTPTSAATNPAMVPTGQPEGVPTETIQPGQDTPVVPPDAGLGEPQQPTPALQPEPTPTVLP